MSRLLHIIIYIGALSFQTVVPAQNKQEAACPIVKLEAERLPDLNIPRRHVFDVMMQAMSV